MTRKLTVLLITKDLFFVPTLQSAATKNDCLLVTALSPDSEKLAKIAFTGVAACVVDLSSMTIEQLPAALNGLRQRFPQATMIAYGPHVQESRLQAAREAHCEHVLTRGQLSRRADELMAKWTERR